MIKQCINKSPFKIVNINSLLQSIENNMLTNLEQIKFFLHFSNLPSSMMYLHSEQRVGCF